MDLSRFWRHVVMSPLKAGRAFPPAVLDAIQRSIAEHERRHRGEVAFVVEPELSTAQLWAGVSSRDRAREAFAAQGIWNTEENNGVLVYVLLADRRVEIVADRGLGGIPAGEWRAICDRIDAHFHAGRFEEGAVAGVAAVSEVLERHFPADGSSSNELPDRPVMM